MYQITVLINKIIELKMVVFTKKKTLKQNLIYLLFQMFTYCVRCWILIFFRSKWGSVRWLVH